MPIGGPTDIVEFCDALQTVRILPLLPAARRLKQKSGRFGNHKAALKIDLIRVGARTHWRPDSCARSDSLFPGFACGHLAMSGFQIFPFCTAS